MLVVALIGILIFRRIAITELQVYTSQEIPLQPIIVLSSYLLEPNWLFRSSADKRVPCGIQ
jgi:hypothetical protein